MEKPLTALHAADVASLSLAYDFGFRYRDRSRGISKPRFFVTARPSDRSARLAGLGQVTPSCPRPLAMPTFCDHVADGLWTNLAPLRVRHFPISRLPETLIPGKQAPRPFALVLDVVIINLKSLLSKGNQDLVPNCDAGFRVTAA